MTAPQEIAALVEHFSRNREAYQSGKYNETQLRREFIDPFFRALGWDMDNAAGHAEVYKDVVHEDAIKVGSATKAPDYCFRIGGTRKFFVEAKKPSVNIATDVGPAYQLRRYAWSAKLPLSILTDFDEFAVYDCRIKPDKSDKASTARIMYLNAPDYLSRWAEIAAIFSKDAVLKGAFDRYADTSKLKKGTAGVDAAFLGEIETWRDMLARNIALRNPHLTQRELNTAVTATINRIIFLRICEDRGIETYGQLMALQNGVGTYERLIKIYYAADDKYNSGLFHFRREKDRPASPDTLALNLAVDDKTLKDIFRSLYYPDSPYEFSVLPADILGQVYEQFLGKVIHLSDGHRAKVEDKPEVKKAGGVYYTPTYIVDYIVRNTVGKLLPLGNAAHDAPPGKVLGTTTPRQAAGIRILDPACGSGSFLLGAYQYLLDWHLGWYLDNEPEKRLKGKSPALCQGSGGDWRLTTSERKRILLNNIYGVDIDPQAVEVTKLSLLLKVLEGENEQTLFNQLKLFHERALPDLGNNIKCGNSLIGPDFYDNQQLGFFDDEERYRVNVFDWKQEFPEIMKDGGFDAVIGNPPYGAEFPKSTFDYLKNNFETSVWRGESYVLFVEKAIGLLKTGGKFGYIIPDTYLNLCFTQSLRTFLLEKSRLREIVSLPVKVFSAATVDTTLLFTDKMMASEIIPDYQVFVRIFNKRSSIYAITLPEREFYISAGNWHAQKAFNIHSDHVETAIIDHAENRCQFVSDMAEMFYGIKAYQVGKGQPPQTELIRDTKPFTSSIKKDEHFLPFFDGKHIGRYSLSWNQDNWLNYGQWLAEPRVPAKFEGEKILIRKIIGKTLIATYVSDTSYCNTLLYVLKIKLNTILNYKFLLGILNSHFIGWYFRKKFQISADDTFPQIMIRDIMQFPIPLSDQVRHDRMVDLVEQMLSLRKKLAAAQTDHEKNNLQRQIDATDSQIDRLVYDLYELTEEEIGIVEKEG